MKSIGIIGIRGYNVIYSGFETFVTYLTKKSSKGVYYYLFCRNSYQKRLYQKKNMSLILVPSIKNKYIETPFYSLLSNLYSLVKKTDIILYLGLSNSPFVLIQKIAGRKIIVNVDGLDWERKRWNILGKLYLRFCELLTVLFADIIISDSLTIYRRYKKKYSYKRIVFIPYGAEVKIRKPGKVLKKYGLKSNEYFHFVGRLTPENSVEDLILAMKKVKTDFKCVIVGDSIYEDLYKGQLLDLAKNDNRIIFTGFLKGKDYEEICSNSALYIESKEVGGIHPSLLEAMAFGNNIIAKDIIPLRDVLENTSLYYTNGSKDKNLAKMLSYFLKNRRKFVSNPHVTKNLIKRKFNWNKVIKAYEELFYTL